MPVKNVLPWGEQLFVDLEKATETITEDGDGLIDGYDVSEGAEDSGKFGSVNGVGGAFAGRVDGVASVGLNYIDSSSAEGGGADGSTTTVGVDMGGCVPSWGREGTGWARGGDGGAGGGAGGGEGGEARRIRRRLGVRKRKRTSRSLGWEVEGG